MLEPGVRKIAAAATKLIRAEVRNEAAARRDRLIALGASEDIVRGLVRLYELDGVFGIAALAARRKVDELALTRAYTRLGEALGLDWAQQQVARFVPADQWERLLTAGLARDFEQLRIDFLVARRGEDPDDARRATGSSAARRASTSSASLIDARADRRPCQRADAGADRQPGADPARALDVRIAVLVPAPDYPEPWDWAYDVEADGADRARAATVEPVAVDRRRRPVAASTWSCRWSPGAITCDYARLARACSTGSKRERLPVVNPPALLRWNSDKAYLAELGDRASRPSRRSPSKRAATRQPRRSAAALRQR